MSTCSLPVITLPLACNRDSCPVTTQEPSLAFGQVSFHTGAVRPGGASYVYSTYTHGLVGKLGASARPSRPRSHWLCTLTDRSANRVGVVSARPSKTLIRPPFSATN